MASIGGRFVQDAFQRGQQDVFGLNVAVGAAVIFSPSPLPCAVSSLLYRRDVSGPLRCLWTVVHLVAVGSGFGCSKVLATVITYVILFNCSF
jgi:hypothetical protein